MMQFAAWPKEVAEARVATGWISEAKSFMPIAQAVVGVSSATVEVEVFWGRGIGVEQAKHLLME